MEKRDDIINATIAIAYENGLEAFTFARLFKVANVGSGTVYNYFASKAELVGATYEHCAALCFKAVSKNHDTSLPFFLQFKNIVTNLLVFGFEYHKEIDFLDRQAHNPSIPANLREYGYPAAIMVQEIVKQGQAEGLIQNALHPREIEQMIAGVVISVTRARIQGEYPMEPTHLDLIADCLWRAVKL